MAAATDFPESILTEADARRWSQINNTAQCWRCGGLMVVERCVDLLDDTGRLNFLAQRCVQCGELVDPIILMNRRPQPPGGLGARKKRGS
jgi:hypothetical protein